VFQRTLRRKIGELLIERGIITAEQLERALEEQRHKGGYISQHLVAMQFATELDIAICLSNQYNFAYLPLNHYAIPAEILTTIPFKWIRLYSLIPIDKIGNSLTVAMADPLNEGVIQMLRQITGCELKVFISTYGEINEAIGRYFKDELSRVKEIVLADMSKLTVINEFIQTKAYTGGERRQFLRLNVKLIFEFNFYGQSFRSETLNVSFGGICFLSPVSIPVDNDIVCKVHLSPDRAVDCIIKVMRVQSRRSEGEVSGLFEIAGVFAFINDEEKMQMVEFLKSQLACNGARTTVEGKQ